MKRPAKILIYGARVIGCNLARIFTVAGHDVTLRSAMPNWETLHRNED